MTDILIQLIDAILQFLSGIVGTGALYEDGSPVIEPCSNPVDAAYLLLRWARYALEAGALGMPEKARAVWALLPVCD